MTVTITSMGILMLRVSEMIRFPAPVMMTLLLVSVFCSKSINYRAKPYFVGGAFGYFIVIKTDNAAGNVVRTGDGVTVSGGLCGRLRCSCFRTGHQR